MAQGGADPHARLEENIVATEVVMPQMGYDMKEGTLLRWLKQEGEQVKRGEVIAEIETDKAAVEMPAYASGVLRKVLVSEGTTVPVGEVVAIIAAPDEEVPEEMLAVGKGAPPPKEAAAAAPQEAPPAAAPAAPPREAEEREAAPAPSAGPIKASPVARRLADEKGIDLRQLEGTGPGGRITKDDVLAHEAQAAKAAPAPAAPAAPAAPPAGPPAAPETVGLSRMRQAIARLTSASKRDIPHFYVSADIDMTRLMELRQQLNQELEEEGIRLSVNDFIVKACAKALQRFPNLNASFKEDHLDVHPSINVGIAIDLEGQGLIVPALMDCGSKGLVEISVATKDLAERTRKGHLTQDEYTAGTFAVSNLGMFNVDSFAAIIFPPQAAVLATGTVRKRPVVRNDEIVVGQVMTATISVDHRVSDGAEAARFMSEVKRLLENPALLLV